MSKPFYSKNKNLAGSYERMGLFIKVQFCIKQILKRVIVIFYPQDYDL